MNESNDARVDTVVLDVDGTLVDTVYHHTLAWARAFAAVDVPVDTWRIHRAIGMGGDRLVAAVAGDDVEDAHGDEVRRLHGEHFGEVIDEVRATPGAARLLAVLLDRGLTVVLASSGEEEQTDRLLGLVDGSEKVHARTTSGDADASKPAPDLIDVAIDKVGGRCAAVIGDATWDVQAAQARGRYCIGLRCGGFGEGELREAGAAVVFDNPDDLVEHLDETPLAG
jgi:phosphoglycolate phosphatase-like HAD superfamily hydrolase